MKCPNDQAEMDKGFFDTSHWISGEKPKMFSVKAPMGSGRKTSFTSAYKCPKCGKIELYANKK